MQNTWAGPYGPPTFPYQLQPRAYDVFAGNKKNVSLFSSVYGVFDFFSFVLDIFMLSVR